MTAFFSWKERFIHHSLINIEEVLHFRFGEREVHEEEWWQAVKQINIYAQQVIAQ